MTVFVSHDGNNDANVPMMNERQALLGNRRRQYLLQKDETNYNGVLSRHYTSVQNEESLDEDIEESQTRTTTRPAIATRNFRLVLVCIGVVSVSFIAYARSRIGENQTASRTGAMRFESMNPRSVEGEQTSPADIDVPPSVRILLEDSVIELWEEWKVPAESIHSGSVWKDSLPSLYHIWQETTLKPETQFHARRLLSYASSASVADSEVVSKKTSSTSKVPAHAPRIKTPFPSTLEAIPIATSAPVQLDEESSSETSKPLIETSKPVSTPSTTSRKHHTKRTPSPHAQSTETKAPSSSESLRETIQEVGQEVESWLKHTWDHASNTTQNVWHKVSDEEHTLVAQLEGNRTSGDSNETWVQEGEDWYHNFVHDLKKLGKHIRSWWVKTENTTEQESREIGDWLNNTEHELAQDERVVQNRFMKWWTKTSAAEQIWWQDTSKKFREYAHDTEEKEKLWWMITRDTSKRDWETLLRDENYLVNETLFWEENVVNATSFYSREAWNTSENALVNAYESTVDEEQKIWHAIHHWYKAHATYQEEMQMPLVYFNTTNAFSLLMNNYGWIDYSQDFFHMQDGLDSQINQAYCAVASCQAILNSFPRDTVSLPIDPIYSPHPYATQRNLFSNNCVQDNVIHHNDSFDGVFHAPGGLSLEQSYNLLECHLDPSDYDIVIVHVDPRNFTLDTVRGDLQLALMDPMARVMVNFDRRVLDQNGGGHFSVLGSYAEREDMFLIMDVAKYKYPPFWVPAARLFASMATVDKCGEWDFPQAQDRVSEDELKKARSNRTIYDDILRKLNCKESYRGYVIARWKRNTTSVGQSKIIGL